MAVTMALEEAGFDVRHEMDGTAGIEALNGQFDDYQALVTDVRLPEVDGWTIAKHARRVSPGIPVIYVTGDSARDWELKGVPNSLLLQKPFANSDLIATLHALLH